MKEKIHVVNVINSVIKKFQEQYILLYEIFLAREDDELKKKNIKKVVEIRIDMEKYVILLTEYAVEKSTLYCLTQLFNTLSILDNCIWLAEKNEITDIYQLNIEEFRYDLDILIQLSQAITQNL